MKDFGPLPCPIDLRAIREENEPLYQRGLSLFEGEKVGEVRRLDVGLFSAKVTGKGGVYRVSVLLNRGGIAVHECECQAHRRYPGPCKHVIALLLKIKEEFPASPSEEGDEFGDGECADFSSDLAGDQ